MDTHRGVERPGRVVRFARLIDRRGRVLGGPAVRAACGGRLKLALIATQGSTADRRGSCHALLALTTTGVLLQPRACPRTWSQLTVMVLADISLASSTAQPAGRRFAVLYGPAIVGLLLPRRLSPVCTP
jgi:hypothetical protein